MRFWRPSQTCSHSPLSLCCVSPRAIRTFADDLDEVQRVSTFARRGQTLGGRFALRYGKYRTRLLPHDATAQQVSRRRNVLSCADGTSAGFDEGWHAVSGARMP
jgi:hypothetical protein